MCFLFLFAPLLPPSTPYILKSCLYVLLPHLLLHKQADLILKPHSSSLPWYPFPSPFTPLLISPPAPDLTSPGPLPSPSAHFCALSPSLYLIFCFAPSRISSSLPVPGGWIGWIRSRSSASTFCLYNLQQNFMLIWMLITFCNMWGTDIPTPKF